MDDVNLRDTTSLILRPGTDLRTCSSSGCRHGIAHASPICKAHAQLLPIPQTPGASITDR
jgi:hypothetical protein